MLLRAISRPAGAIAWIGREWLDLLVWSSRRRRWRCSDAAEAEPASLTPEEARAPRSGAQAVAAAEPRAPQETWPARVAARAARVAARAARAGRAAPRQSEERRAWRSHPTLRSRTLAPAERRRPTPM